MIDEIRQHIDTAGSLILAAQDSNDDPASVARAVCDLATAKCSLAMVEDRLVEHQIYIARERKSEELTILQIENIRMANGYHYESIGIAFYNAIMKQLKAHVNAGQELTLTMIEDAKDVVLIMIKDGVTMETVNED